MPDISLTDVADIVQTTLKSLDKGKWTDLTGDIQKYHAMTNLLKGSRVKTDDGESIRVNIMTDDNGQFRWASPYAVDSYAFNDVMANGSAPWRTATFNYTFNRVEVAINASSEKKIVDLVKTRRAAAFIAAAKGLEDAFWGKPATSSDVTTMWGIDMYIVRNASEGFNGGNPSGFTTGAIFDSSTQTRWKNYTAQYTNVSKTDLLDKMSTAVDKTEFESPISMSEIRSKEVDRALYTNYDVFKEVKRQAQLQNDNLGSDLDKYAGNTFFRKLPFMWVPQLDSDSQDPVYGVDWSTFCPVFLEGENFKESKPEKHPHVHRAVKVDVDLTLNMVCYDHRRQFIINKA